MSEENNNDKKEESANNSALDNPASSDKESAASEPANAASEASPNAVEPTDEEKEAKAKAAAEARAARAAARAQRAEGGENPPAAAELSDEEKEAKAKAAAEARAARAAARAQRAEGGEGAPAPTADAGDDEKEAKAKAAAEARAARAAARAQKAEGGEGGADGPKEPSPKQPLLDRIVQLIKENVSDQAVVEAAINERDRHLPTLTINPDHWVAVAEFVKSSDELQLNYLSNLSGVDYETYLETVYYVLALSSKQGYCFKVKTNRDTASIPSVTPVWATANWNEREVYDLLGIDFPGHPDLRRIMMPDDWVGYPLRKDYEPIDPEV